jgi:hypothetical protein
MGRKTFEVEKSSLRPAFCIQHIDPVRKVSVVRLQLGGNPGSSGRHRFTNDGTPNHCRRERIIVGSFEVSSIQVE